MRDNHASAVIVMSERIPGGSGEAEALKSDRTYRYPTLLCQRLVLSNNSQEFSFVKSSVRWMVALHLTGFTIPVVWSILIGASCVRRYGQGQPQPTVSISQISQSSFTKDGKSGPSRGSPCLTTSICHIQRHPTFLHQHTAIFVHKPELEDVHENAPERLSCNLLLQTPCRSEMQRSARVPQTVAQVGDLLAAVHFLARRNLINREIDSGP